MLASHKWLMEWSGLSLAPSEVAKRLTSAGLEVESMRACGENLQGVVIAEVRAMRAHPSRDKLRLVTLFDGEREQEVVCGAPNVPEPKGLVAFARLGATLPNSMRIEERKLGGVVSCGMICSEKELDLGADEDGILLIEVGAGRVPGAALADALGLRDTIYEIGLTPNRPDCLGHLGIARELCALLDKPFAWPSPSLPQRWLSAATTAPTDPAQAFSLATELGAKPAQTVSAEPPVNNVRVQIEGADRCPRYAAAVVAGLRVGPSPFALRYRLHTLGLRAISNVVDATNLVLLGFGHPIHAFDLQKVRGSRIVVRRAQNGEAIQTLDGQSHKLSDDDLLICDGEGPVALAGVMGGASSEISASTTQVLIECAYFDARSVRRTSKRTGLHTDSSHRFERGVDPRGVRGVLAYAAALIAELSGGAVAADALDVYPTPIAPKQVRFRSAKASALLGASIDVKTAAGIFERLGCTVRALGSELDVELPTFRPDLSREIDLIEEYARVQGYDSIPTATPSLRPSVEGNAPEIGFVRRLREVGAASGLWEAVNFAFVAPADLEKSRVSTEAPRVANPMTEERSVLRTALLPGLLQNLRNAQRHAQHRFSGFEVARVFAPSMEAVLPAERYELGVLLWGLRQSWYDEREVLDFYDAKGVLETITHALTGSICQTLLDESLDASAPFLHPKRRAAVLVQGQRVGCLGELHPDVRDAFELEGRPVYAVLDVPALLAVAQACAGKPIEALPRFPASTRDLAVVVSEELPVGEVATVLHSVAGELAESVRLFDIYRGAPVPAGHKSLAFHVVYRDPKATLTDKLVDEAHARVTQAAEQRFAGAVRK